MATGMVMATTANGLAALSTWRIVTGLGIGGMLAAINAVATEFSNARRRHLSVSLMSIGYPLGAVFGGIAAARLLVGHDWRTVFYFGAAMTAVLIPIVFVFVPESVHWLVRKQPAGALQRVNRSLTKIGYATTDALPDIPADVRGRAFADVFAARQISGTVIVTLAYFLHITTFYFIVKWVPKIVVDLGFAASSAAGVLVWTNVGGAIGGAVLGLLTQKYSVKTLTIVVLLASTAAVAAFGQTPADLQRLSIICGLCGFSINAGIVGLYAIIAQVFPTHIRASGTGFTIGVGRGGSVFAPIIAGFLFAAGYGLPIVALLLGLGSLFAAGVLLLLRLETDQPTAERTGYRVAAAQIPAPGHAR
jgi:MFS family permease